MGMTYSVIMQCTDCVVFPRGGKKRGREGKRREETGSEGRVRKKESGRRGEEGRGEHSPSLILQFDHWHRHKGALRGSLSSTRS